MVAELDKIKINKCALSSYEDLISSEFYFINNNPEKALQYYSIATENNEALYDINFNKALNMAK